MIQSERVFNDNVKIVVRQDGFRVYLLTNLVDRLSLQQVNCTDIEVASIKGSFDFELLSLLTKIEMLTFMEVDVKHVSVERLLELPELKRLVMVDCTMPGSVNLSSFRTLEELDLNWKSTYHFTDGCTLKDLVVRRLCTNNLSFLNCKSLETLEVIQGKLLSLKGIDQLSNLKALTLVGLKNISTLNPISSLHDLEYLDLRGIKSTMNSHSIMELSRLKWLILENSDLAMSLEPLLEHRSLKGLKILKRGKLTDTEKKLMSTFPDTRYGYFRSNNVRDRLRMLSETLEN